MADLRPASQPNEALGLDPEDHLLWGADCSAAENIYGATVAARAVIAEALPEKVDRGELREEDAVRIGGQILRDNALAL